MSSSPRFQILPEGRADVRFARWLSLESRDTATLAEMNLTAADARALVVAGKIKMLDAFIDTTPPAPRPSLARRSIPPVLPRPPPFAARAARIWPGAAMRPMAKSTCGGSRSGKSPNI